MIVLRTLLFLLLISTTCCADDWSRFRGPHGDGVSDATNLPLEWSATKNVVWEQKLPGPGSSSPIIWGDHVYVTCYSGYGLDINSPGDLSRLQRHLVCVDRKNGTIIWSKSMASASRVARFVGPTSIGRHGYASSTSVADESGVFVFYGSSGVVAYTHAGKFRWQASCGTKTFDWGTASSPLLYKNLLIVHADVESHALIALDKRTGREQWRLSNTRGPSTWCTPIVVKVKGQDELVYSSGNGKLAGVDPQRGHRLWECQTHVGLINSSPIAFGDIVVVFGDGAGKAAAVRIGGRGDVTATHKLWENHHGTYISSPVGDETHYYFTRDGRIVNCVEAKTGKLVYRQRIASGEICASPVLADGKLYYVSTTSGTFVVAAKPEFELLAHNVIETDKTIFNGSPAVSDGQLFLRSNQSLYCISKKNTH